MSTVGLVLSGGGAKGAYQAGVLKALVEMDISIDMVAGASIGALNGAVVASAPSLLEGAERLQLLWAELAKFDPIKMNTDFSTTIAGRKLKIHPAAYFAFLLASGLRLSTPVGLASLLLTSGSSIDIDGLLSDESLVTMMHKYLDIDNLQSSIPFYVSVFPQRSANGLVDLISAGVDVFKAEIIGVENKPSEFWHIQSKPLAEQKQMILASAALPFLYKAYEDKSGKRYTDGGQGGWLSVQGNTPITPLIEAGCNHMIVTHLSDGSIWHRHDFPDTTIIEIRPSINIGGMSKVLDFSENHINTLLQAGYEDTLAAFKKITISLDSLKHKRKANKDMMQSFDDVEKSHAKVNSALERLKSL